MESIRCVTGAGLLLLFATSTFATDVERGRQIATEGNGKGAAACASCHGVNGAGNGSAGFPRLAGLNAIYLSKQLADFKAGKRDNPVMDPIASALTAEGGEAAAAYFAQAQTKFSGERPSMSPEVLERGKRLAERGDWDKGLPACVSCHGPDGMGVGEAFPRIAGQHANYISSQIKAWQEGARRNDPVQLMKAVADKLSDSDTAAVAAYFAGLKQQ